MGKPRLPANQTTLCFKPGRALGPPAQQPPQLAVGVPVAEGAVMAVPALPSRSAASPEPQMLHVAFGIAARS